LGGRLATKDQVNGQRNKLLSWNQPTLGWVDGLKAYKVTAMGLKGGRMPS